MQNLSFYSSLRGGASFKIFLLLKHFTCGGFFEVRNEIHLQAEV